MIYYIISIITTTDIVCSLVEAEMIVPQQCIYIDKLWVTLSKQSPQAGCHEHIESNPTATLQREDCPLHLAEAEAETQGGFHRAGNPCTKARDFPSRIQTLWGCPLVS